MKDVKRAETEALSAVNAMLEVLEKCLPKIEKSNPFPKGTFTVSGNTYNPTEAAAEDHQYPKTMSHHAAFKMAQEHSVPLDSYMQSKHEFENPAADPQNHDTSVDFHKFMAWLGY
jgi:hypothetical protein